MQNKIWIQESFAYNDNPYIHYSIIDESGTSIYSVSNTATDEFGNLDPKLISAG